MKLTKKYIWDYNVNSLDLSNKKTLLWYLKRKIEHGDWKVLDRKTLKENLRFLKIDPYLKQILRGFLKKYGPDS